MHAAEEVEPRAMQSGAAADALSGENTAIDLTARTARQATLKPESKQATKTIAADMFKGVWVIHEEAQEESDFSTSSEVWTACSTRYCSSR